MDKFISLIERGNCTVHCISSTRLPFPSALTTLLRRNPHASKQMWHAPPSTDGKNPQHLQPLAVSPVCRLQRAREPGASPKFKSFLSAGMLHINFYTFFQKSQPKVSSKRSPPHPSSAAVSAAKEANRAASSVLLPAPLSGKLSTGRLETICELLKDGKNTIENACDVAGVGRTSLYDSASCSGGRRYCVAFAPHDGGDYSGKHRDVCGVSCTCYSL
jgi:hypothetical protein